MTKRKRTRRGWGWLRQTSGGRWHASYVGPDLVRHNAPMGTFDTKLDGEYWLAQERRLIASGEWTPPRTRGYRRAEGPTLAEYAPKVLDRRRVKGRPLKPRTRAHYDSLLRRVILPELGPLRLTELTEERVSVWHDDMDPEHETQRAHAYALLRVIMNAAVADRAVPLVKVNPCTVTGAGQTSRKRRIEPATLAELEALAAATPERLRLMPLLAAWCGLRFGEVAELRRGDVDTVAGVVHVSRALSRVDRRNIVGTPKSGAGERTVHVPPHLVPALVDHLERFTPPRKDALMFPHSLAEPDRHLTHGWYYKDVHVPAREAAGRPDLRFHDLRHTGATLAAMTGATLAELMGRLGHSTAAAALRYQHVAGGRDAEIAARLSRMVEGDR